MKKYQLIASGTFDLLHNGHKSFLRKSFEIADDVVVCITTDVYVESFKPQGIEDFETRKSNVVKFLESIGKRDRAIIIPINDIYGPLLTSKYSPQGIAVTAENYKNAEKINSKRAKKGLPKLEIKVISMDSTQDSGVISSARIRKGEIDREGNLYINPSWLEEALYITDEIRQELKNPFGELIVSPEKKDFEEVTGVLASVGDESTKFLKSLSIRPAISVVDFKVARKKKFSRLSDLGFTGSEEVTRVKNEPGTLSPELFKAASFVSRGGKDQESVVLIDGEDDLAVIPLLLALSLGSYVFYGQPGQGIVRVLVSEENKKRAYDVASRFITRGH